MPREVDERKKRRALRKLRRAADLAEQGLGPPLSDWEVSFLEELEERIETYGSAFADPNKGDLDEPLSALQKQKLKEIDKKARGKGKTPKGRHTANARLAAQDEAPDVTSEDRVLTPPPTPLSVVASPSRSAPQSTRPEDESCSESRRSFRVIDGGRKD